MVTDNAADDDTAEIPAAASADDTAEIPVAAVSDTAIVDRLRRRWQAQLPGVPWRDRDAAFDRLIAEWRTGLRHHHGLGHLDEALDACDALAALPAAAPSDPSAVRLALFFHDAADPAAADGVERSAAMAEESLSGLGVVGYRVAEVGRLVRLTERHDPDAGDGDGALVCDADLSVLASSADRYERYRAGVRAEYPGATDEQWAAGRAAVLEGLLGRRRLFSTGPGRALLEPHARVNLARELAALRRGG